MFASLRVRNYRLFFAGQAVSMIGTWMQAVAISWLAFELSHSGTTIGLVLAVEFVPVLLLGAYGGLIADRARKRRLLMAAQTALGLLALLLGVLAISGAVDLWMVFATAGGVGLVLAVDNPARQAFLAEMVGDDLVQNAVSLNSVLTNSSRAVGPAIAGGLIATTGVGVCFVANAASFLAVLAALALMRPAELAPSQPVGRAPGQIRQGLRYVRATPGLLAPLIMMALIGTLAYEFPVVLPVLARRALDGGPEVFGLLTSAIGIGAVAGGLLIASVGVAGLLPLTAAALCFGMAIALAALAPTLASELLVLVLVGVASTAFMATGNTTLQLVSAPSFRGRVMALWSVTFLGSTPIGGPLVGFVAQQASPRYALALGAVSCLLGAALGAATLRRLPPGSGARVLRNRTTATQIEVAQAVIGK